MSLRDAASFRLGRGQLEDAVPPQIPPECFQRVRRFLLHEMDREETLEFSRHAQACFDCRECIRSLRDLLLSRQSILQQLASREAN